MLEFLIRIIINFLCGAIVMIAHELPKSVAAHFLTHSVFRKKRIQLPALTKYIDPIGLILFGFSSYGIGWQKPYDHNPNRLKDKERSLMAIALTGQLSSLLFMLFCVPIFRLAVDMNLNFYLGYTLFQLIKFNMVIFIVNLLPVPPLDMSKMIYAYSPNTYFRLMQNERYIHTAFILLVAFGIIESFAGQILVPFLSYFL